MCCARSVTKLLAKWPVVVLVVAATATLPCDGADTDEHNQRTFELLVVDSDGEPVPHASVQLRTTPATVASQIKVGEFTRKARYGSFAKTDAKGRLLFEIPTPPGRFNISIKTPGYGPYWAGWSSSPVKQTIPASFTAQLDRAWRVGLIVVDETGKPIEGVQVHPSIKYKKRPGDFDELHMGARMKTDADGKCSFASVPESLDSVFAEISHPEFMPDRRRLTRGQFAIKSGDSPVEKVTLKRGLTVAGTVTDEAGAPIVGALIRTKFFNDVREAKTGDDGSYKLVGCEERMARIVVSAKGKATDMKELRVSPDMEPVDFQMKPGGRIRIRVLNEKDQPVARARIFFQYWRGRISYFEFDHISQFTNQNGVWEWNEAPLDEFKADICRPGGMQLGEQPLLARDEEYVFRPPPALVISGGAVDAETKEPIKEFLVLPGILYPGGRTSWTRSQQFSVKDGRYQITHVHDAPQAHLVRIEAAGYLPAVSRGVANDEGKIAVNFELKRGKDVAALVVTPDGQPAVDAQVALGIAGSQISIEGGKIDSGSTRCSRQDTDESGRFRFSPQESAFQLVILHPRGYAHVKATTRTMRPTIELQPWARVEGTFKIGKAKAGGVRLTLNTGALHSYGADVPNIFTSYETTTQPDGSFTFDRVFPGQAYIGRHILLLVDEGATEATSSGRMPFDLVAGETARVMVGGAGRPVIGSLQPPKGFEGKPNWHFALMRVRRYLPQPPKPVDPPIPADVDADPVKKAAWWVKWRQTPAGRAYTAWERAVEVNTRLRDSSPSFTVTVASDGTFRADDVPGGEYTLSVSSSRKRIGQLAGYRFTVPPAEGGQSDTPADLGAIALE